jgi:hypothetical protein
MPLTRHSKHSLAEQTPESAQALIEQELVRILDMNFDVQIGDWSARIDQTFASSAIADRFGNSLRRVFPFLKASSPIARDSTWRDLVRAILHAAGHELALF